MVKPLDPRLVRRSAAVRRYLVISALLGTATAALVVGQAWFIARVVSRGFAGSPIDAVTGLVVGLAALFAGRAVVTWGHQVAANRAAAGVKTRLRIELLESVLDPRRSGDRPVPGEVSTLLGSGLDAMDGYFARYLPQLVLAMTVPATVVIAMATADLIAAITVALTLPLIPVFMILVGWLTRERTERRWHALQRLGRHFADVLAGLTVLKSYDRDQSSVLAKSGEEHRVSAVGALRLAFLSTAVLELLATISVALVAVGVGLRIVEGNLELGVGLFVLLLAPEAFAPVRQVGTQYHASAEGVAASHEVFALLEATRPGRGMHRAGADALIEFSDVEVRYADRADPALRPVSFTIEPGRATRLAGASGAGKSTVLAVILGLQKPSRGRVTVDGIDLADLDLADWRRRIAWVPQTPGLIAGTIEENVRFGDARLDRSEVRAILDEVGGAGLDLDREVAEGGANLSAGERRRIGVARALCRVWAGGVDLALVDEPTAGLDGRTESSVLAAIEAAGITVVMVSHRHSGPVDAVVELAGGGR